MKLNAGDKRRLLSNPPGDISVILIYGPDVGQVRDVGETLLKSVVEDPNDPFRVAELTADSLRHDPARLADEAASMALTGGRRVVRIRGASDPLTDICRSFLDNPIGDALILVEAGALEARSKLRGLFEKAKNAAAFPCYTEEGRSLEETLQREFARHRVQATAEAMSYLLNRLGADRLATRSEIEKLCLYVGDGGRAGIEDVRACIEDGSNLAIDDIAFAVADGSLETLDVNLARAYGDGVAVVQILRALQRHFQRLQLAAARIADGADADSALRALRPPVFFAKVGPFKQQAARWSVKRLEDALRRLAEAELLCKTTGMPERAICGQTLLGLAMSARRR